MQRRESVDSVFAAWGLILAAWLACIAPLPWFFYALAGYLTAGGPGHASLNEVGALGAGPVTALVALLSALFCCQRSGKRLAAMVAASLLILGELGFLLVFWIGK
jgi:hypothetical protein